MSNISNRVKRPGLGRQGRAIQVRVNFFKITSLPNSNIHHYSVTITPNVRLSENRKIYCELENLQINVFGHVKPVFDGRANIFAIKPLPLGDDDVATFDVTLPENNGTPTPRSFKVKIRKVNVINMEDLRRFIDGKCVLSTDVLMG